MWEVHFKTWEISRETSSRKDQEGLERWRPYTFRKNYSVNLHAFVLETGPHDLIEKITSEVAERKSA